MSLRDRFGFPLKPDGNTSKATSATTPPSTEGSGETDDRPGINWAETVRPSVKATEENPLVSVLRGEMIGMLVKKLQEKPTPVGAGEHIKLSGSAASFMIDNDIAKCVKIPSDLDLAVHTTNGLIPRGGWPEEKIKNFVSSAGKELGYSFTSIPALSGDAHCGTITATFDKQHILEIISQKNLDGLLSSNNVDINNLPESITVSLPLHYVHNPINVMEPKPGTDKIKPFMRDDMLDVISVKLAKIILGNHDGALKDGNNIDASDMLDVSRILAIPELRDEAMRDLDLLRSMVVVRLAERIEMKRDEVNNLDHSCEELHEKRGIQFAFGDKNIEAFKKSLKEKGFLIPDDESITTTLQQTNALVGQLFPERDQTTYLPLTNGEKQFLQKAISPDTNKRSVDSVNMALLYEGKKNPFTKYPGLEEVIHYSCPLNEAIDGHGAMRDYH